MVNITLNLKKELKTKEILFGAKRTIKILKGKEESKRIEKIYFAKDCPEDIKEEIKNLAELKQIGVIYLDLSREELKELCKKPFNISVLDVLSEKKKEAKAKEQYKEAKEQYKEAKEQHKEAKEQKKEKKEQKKEAKEQQKEKKKEEKQKEKETKREKKRTKKTEKKNKGDKDKK